MYILMVELPQNKILPAGSATSGDHILIVNDIAAMDTYIDASNIFDVVLENTGLFFNGDDVVEIVFDGNPMKPMEQLLDG